MKTYELEHTDLEVSRIAYGCLAMGRKWGEITWTEARKYTAQLMNAVLEQGINCFDHADIYANGRSEELFGDVLKEWPDIRDSIVIQTKCGVRFRDTPTGGEPFRYDFSYDHIVSSAEASLKRLRVDCIDILLLHRPDPLMEPEEVARAFDDLRRGGKVQYFGVSNFSPGQMKALQKQCSQPLVVNQLQLSLLHNHLINEGVSFNQGRFEATETTGALDHCQAKGVRVQPWTPLGRGRIIDPPDDATDLERALAGEIAAQAEAGSTSREAIALAWLLRHPAGLQPVIGTTDGSRIAACGLADRVEMSREAWYTLFNIARGNPVP